ncbi:AhpC/TSA family protein [Puniceicoccaceae bacterium K14]|nr:AhpC/TSA family protein [Puniceicoccaceae bacterium K14]
MKRFNLIKVSVLIFIFIAFAVSTKASVGANSIRPVLIGSDAPNAAVLDSEGKSVELAEIYDGKPTIVVFYRGGWCPYCNTHLQELVEVEPQLIELGYQIIALSPDAPSKLQESTEKGGLNYSLFSDSPHEAAEAFGVAFTLEERTLERYKKKDRLGGWSDGVNQDKLPVPSVFIVTGDQKIAFQYVDPNFRSRMPGDLLLAAAKSSLRFGE